jgi:putative sterol carrier protein
MIPYATPEWLEAVVKNYKDNPENENRIFKGMTIFISFHIQTDPKFGIERDIYFGTRLDNGVLQDDSALMSKEDAEKRSDFILGAPPPTWKRLIKKERGFVNLVMTGKIKIEKGLPPKILSLAPKSPALVECFYKVDTEWPDEMPPERLEQYKAQVKDFREKLGI